MCAVPWTPLLNHFSFLSSEIFTGDTRIAVSINARIFCIDCVAVDNHNFIRGVYCRVRMKKYAGFVELADLEEVGVVSGDHDQTIAVI